MILIIMSVNYNTGFGFPFHLFNEYLAASFLKIWKLNVPDFSFVQKKKEHTLHTNNLFYYFDNLCFGSKFHGEFTEVDKIFLQTKILSKDNITARDTFLRIGLFDIWLCNEDRHYENFNLLYDLKSKVFIPIDHVDCFNGLNIDKERYPISPNESILSSPFLNRFLTVICNLNLTIFVYK